MTTKGVAASKPTSEGLLAVNSPRPSNGTSSTNQLAQLRELSVPCGRAWEEMGRKPRKSM